MSALPKVFISATSGDLRSIRQPVKEALLTINCHPVEQTNFEPDWRTVAGMLRGKIEGCQALIHIAGRRYGAEPDPATLPPGTPRRSYTQMEYHLGRELQQTRGDDRFRVYTFICPEAFPYDAEPDAEPEERRALQRAHRAALMAGTHLYETPADPATLNRRVLALQEEVIRLRSEQDRLRRRTQVVGGLLVVGLAGLGWGVARLTRQTETLVEGQQAVVTNQVTLQQQQAEVLEKLNADPEYLRAQLRTRIESRAKAELEAEKAGGNDWRKLDEITKRRETALSKVDDIVATIKSGLIGEPDPIFLEATRLLETQGIAEALEYLQAQEQRLWDEARQAGALQAEAAQRQQDALRPLLLKAELHETQLEISAKVF